MFSPISAYLKPFSAHYSFKTLEFDAFYRANVHDAPKLYDQALLSAPAATALGSRSRLCVCWPAAASSSEFRGSKSEPVNISGQKMHNKSLPLRSLIVDDESSARQFLRKRLAPHSEIEVIGEAESNAKALRVFKTLRPDVIFLDINMPQSHGMELPALLPVNSRPAIVFVTAHDEHACEAFEVEAVDYLLKPYSTQRMATTIKKLRKHFFGPVDDELEVSPPLELSTQAPKSIMVRDEKQLIQLNPKEIALIKTEGDYSRLTLITGKSYLLRQSLTRWAELLPQDVFLRVDRFSMINVECILKLERVSRNKTFASLRGLNEPKNLGRVAGMRLTQRMKDRVIV